MRINTDRLNLMHIAASRLSRDRARINNPIIKSRIRKLLGCSIGIMAEMKLDMAWSIGALRAVEGVYHRQLQLFVKLRGKAVEHETHSDYVRAVKSIGA